MNHRQHLLDEQRIALRRRGDSPAKARLEGKTVEQAVDQLVGLLCGERLEQHARGVELAAAPAGHLVEQLGPGEAEDLDRRVPAPVGHVLDELEERGLAPVEIVDENDQGRLAARASSDSRIDPGEKLLRRARLTDAGGPEDP